MRQREQIEDLLHKRWLPQASAQTFWEKLDRIRHQFSFEKTPVLAAERNPVDFLAVFFAALLADRPVVAGNPDWGRQEWQQALESTGGRWVRATGDEAAPSRRTAMTHPLNPGEILIPTGGSRGHLRFARHSWKTLSASAEGFALFFGARPVRSVCVLPLFHVSGLLQVIRALVTGGEVTLADWRDLEAGKVPPVAEDFFLSLVPAQLGRLLTVEEIHPWLRTAKAILIGGAAARAPLLEEAARLQLPLALCYGATETAAMVTAQKPGDFLNGDRSSGLPLPHASFDVIGPNGEDLPPGHQGRIRISSQSLFSGYVPGDASIRSDWLTGDLGRIDQAGRLTIIGREDQIIITGGEKVFPGEVERVLLASGLIDDVLVFGVDDAQWGQAVTAIYVSRAAANSDLLRRAVKEELAAFKAPKFWLRAEEIPRTAQGKIDWKRIDVLLLKSNFADRRRVGSSARTP